MPTAGSYPNFLYTMSNTDTSAISSYLSFKIGNELFAVNVAKVIEILEWAQVTRVPQAPAFMRGVINLRGSVLPVIDTRLKFGFEVAPETVNTCIIVLEVEIENENVRLGAMADAVQEVLELGPQDIAQPPRIGSKYQVDYISGMVRAHEQFIMVLDVDKVFSSDELSVIQQPVTLADE